MGQNDRSACSVSSAVVLLLMGLVLAGLLAGGAVFYRFRQSQALEIAMRQRNLAQLERKQAAIYMQLLKSREQALAAGKMSGKAVASDSDEVAALAGDSLVTLELDSDGGLRAEDERIETTQLEDWLKQRRPARVTLHVNPQCAFAKVLEIQKICQAAGATSLSFGALEPAEPTNTVP